QNQSQSKRPQFKPWNTNPFGAANKHSVYILKNPLRLSCSGFFLGSYPKTLHLNSNDYLTAITVFSGVPLIVN
ncbi:MAG TPA: hypothetical protein DEB18_12585, partial [Leeuwenhoekiella sp.]|nr:hypothetical protein [Leeuwenhoekiella sp.]